VSVGAEDAAAAATTAIRAALADGFEFEEPAPGRFVVVLPGDRKQRTTCSLIVGTHALSINAFVARHPDEDHAAVHAWLLERNLRTYAVSFAIDGHGDIYLAGRVGLHSVTVDEVDRILGSVLEYADGSFNTILELGFHSAIAREWAWRTSRAESTANLSAFRHLADPSG
jgi:Putative bacterial sensory transduction regulator